MSRYADKKRPWVGCRVPRCVNPGVELRIIDGILGWYCAEHRNK